MKVTERAVKRVLADPFAYKWTVQGFGMLRTYLDHEEVHRLHIWDVDTAVPEVSVIHDHPWDFTSRIFAGLVKNQRYLLDREYGDTVRTGRIKTGEGGGLVADGTIRDAQLYALPREQYGPGDWYRMDRPELHESIPTRGAVTIISRQFHTARDDQFATVCWAAGTEWVTAEPRPATKEEIMHFIGLVDM